VTPATDADLVTDAELSSGRGRAPPRGL